MKRFIATTILVVFSVILAVAQPTQKGYVKTKGRMNSQGQLIPGKRLAGAAIQLTGGRSTVADANGNFTLTVPDKKFVLSNVQKQGYVLTDPEVLKKQYVCSANPLVISMETREQQADDQLAAERKLRRQLQRQLMQKEQEIDSLKEINKLNEEEYRLALQKLYAEQENNEMLISEMAKRYTEIDYDLLDEFYRQVSFCIENGELVKADSLLRTRGDVRQQVLEQQRKGQALQEQREQLHQAETVFAADNEELARRCYSYFEKFSAQFMNDSAAYYLELRAELDTTNVDWQLEAGDYIDEYLADYEKAKVYLQRALRLTSAQKDKDISKLSVCYNTLGYVYDHQGEYDQALDNYQKALSVSESEYGENHPAVAAGYNNLGTLYASKGDYSQALNYHLKSLGIKQKLLEENHPDVATSYINIGYVYERMGEYTKAMENYQKSLEIRKLVYGENHPTVAECYNNMGGSYFYLSDLTHATECYQKALAIRKSVFGESHPAVAESYNNLGFAYYSAQDFSTAMDYYQKALAIWKSFYGEKHPNIAVSYNNMGYIHFYQGESERAKECFLKSLTIRKSIFGDNHPDVVEDYNNLGTAYASLKDFAKSLECFQKSLSICKTLYGDDHAITQEVSGYVEMVKRKLEKEK
ncbi:MAG: tetratricopeptide repeat protein [Bacteroidales bacterium]|nr:tetratricopeptide repeat protein [Bacteroidales bacterium]